MPAKTQTMRTSHLSKPSSGLNFELPIFKFDHESLVAGTNIPPPSREPSPAPVKRQEKKEPAAHAPVNGAPQANGSATASTLEQAATTSAATVPGTKRPHHVRRLLSLRSLSQTFSNHGRSDSMESRTEESDFGPAVRTRSRTPSIFGRSSTSTWRPESRSGMSTVGSTLDGATDGGRPNAKKRMSSGFWKRRSSVTMARLEESPNEAASQRKKTPPPQLPEISKLDIGKVKTRDGNFLSGEDMFKGIKYRPEI